MKDPCTIALELDKELMAIHDLKPAHNGCFYVNETAAKDDLCQQVMASYINTLKAEAQRRDRIRQGLEAAPEGQWGNWSISDRD